MKKFLSIILCIVVVMVLSFCVYNSYTNDTTETHDATAETTNATAETTNATAETTNATAETTNATAETTLSDTTSTVPDFCRTAFDSSYFRNLTQIELLTEGHKYANYLASSQFALDPKCSYLAMNFDKLFYCPDFVDSDPYYEELQKILYDGFQAAMSNGVPMEDLLNFARIPEERILTLLFSYEYESDVSLNAISFTLEPFITDNKLDDNIADIILDNYSLNRFAKLQLEVAMHTEGTNHLLAMCHLEILSKSDLSDDPTALDALLDILKSNSASYHSDHVSFEELQQLRSNVMHNRHIDLYTKLITFITSPDEDIAAYGFDCAMQVAYGASETLDSEARTYLEDTLIRVTDELWDGEQVWAILEACGLLI